MAKMTNYGANIAGLNRSLRKLPKEAKAELKGASHDAAQLVAESAKSNAAFLRFTPKGGGWKYLGPTIRAGSSSSPEVKIGGKRRIPGRKGGSADQTVGNLLWGLEFGGGARMATNQFYPHLGTTGHALWPAVRAKSDQTFSLYSKALLHALEDI